MQHIDDRLILTVEVTKKNYKNKQKNKTKTITTTTTDKKQNG